MGFTQALGYAEFGLAGLAGHLQGNHYPPIPLSMLPVAQKAIRNANRGEWAKKVKLPEGVTYRDGSKSVATSNIVASLHLNAWVTSDDED